jgi:hypothetical protein
VRGIERAVREQISDTRAIDALVREPWPAIAEQTGLVDPHDAGMLQRFEDARFAQELDRGDRVLVLHDFEQCTARQYEVPALVDDNRGAPTALAVDAIVANPIHDVGIPRARSWE